MLPVTTKSQIGDSRRDGNIAEIIPIGEARSGVVTGAGNLTTGDVMNEFVTTSQAARVIGGSSRTIAKLFDTGTLAGFKVNADRRIHVESFKKYLRTISTSKSTVMTLLLRLDRIASEVYGERGR